MKHRNTAAQTDSARLKALWMGRILTVVLLSGLLVMLAACPMSAPMGPGVTTGGQQDIAAARRTIEDGGVPDPASITVEGFLSEHSIPIEEPEDAGLLYVAASTAWNMDFDAFTPLATIQIGFGTTIDEESFQRDPLNLCIVIDRSGSMDGLIDERSGTSKLSAVKIAIDRLLAQLDANDRVSLVTFNNEAKTTVEAVPGNDIASIKTALDEIDARGGTNLARGIRQGYRTARRNSGDGRSDRLIVFTDALLTWMHNWEVSEFIEVMEEYAEDNVGATVFGVGVDFGHQVANDISQVRGGNYFFLSDYERIVSVFDEEFDFLVTPIAYDVSLTISVPFAFDVEGIYGLEGPDPLPHLLELEIPTLFLSSRQGGGAVLARVRAGGLVDLDEENLLADIDLSYTTPGGETITHPSIEATLPAGLDSDGGERYFESEATRRAVLLLNTALVLRGACEDAYNLYWYYYPADDLARATARLTEFLPYFDSLAEGLPDRASETSRSLSQERALLVQLLDNLGGIP